MMLSLTLLFDNASELQKYQFKASKLHEILLKYDRCNVSIKEFYEILRLIREQVEKIDHKNSNSKSAVTEIDNYYIISSSMHVIEFQSHSYKSTLIAKQYYT